MSGDGARRVSLTELAGQEVDTYYRAGRIREIADYCESDVVNTYRVWLRYELFRGRLSDAAFRASEDSLTAFMKVRTEIKPHLADLTGTTTRF